MDEEVGALDVAQDGVRGDEQWQDEAWEAPLVPRWWGWLAFVLSVAGFGVSLYLTVEHFSGGLLSCPESGVINCIKVTTSPESEVFGVFPVALLGLLFYTGLVVVNVPALWHMDGRLGRWVAYSRLGLVVTGMGTVIYLLYAELFEIKAVCLYCTGVHVVTFLLFVLVVATFSTTVAAHDERQG